MRLQLSPITGQGESNKPPQTSNSSTNVEQISEHAEDLIKLSACISLPLQAKETSNKPPQTGNSSTKGKKVEKFSLEDSESVVNEYNDETLMKILMIQLKRFLWNSLNSWLMSTLIKN